MSTPTETEYFKQAQTGVIIGDIALLNTALCRYPDLITKSDSGDTLLHIAADNSQYEISKFLLELNADPNCANSSGETPLHLAVFRSAKLIVRLLLRYKASPNKSSLQGKTPLHYAAEYEESEIMRSLILYGANPLLQDLEGNTPLHESQELRDLITRIKPIVIINEVSPSEESETAIDPDNKLTTFGECCRRRTERISFTAELFDFLSNLSLSCYFIPLVSSGFDNLGLMLFQMRTQIPITNSMLKEIGIDKAGDRCKLMVNLERLALEENYTIKSSGLEEFLRELRLDKYYSDFVSAGYDDLKILIEMAVNLQYLNRNILQAYMGIIKPGHQYRILGALMVLGAEKQKEKHSCEIV